MISSRLKIDEAFFGEPENFHNIDAITKTLAANVQLIHSASPTGSSILHYFACHPKLCKNTENFLFLAFMHPELLIVKDKQNDTALRIINRRFPDGQFSNLILQLLLEVCANTFRSGISLPQWCHDLFQEYKYELCSLLLNAKDSFSIKVLTIFKYGLLALKEFKFLHDDLSCIVYLREFEAIDRASDADKIKQFSLLFEKLIKSKQSDFIVELQRIVVEKLTLLVDTLDQTTPYLLHYLLNCHLLEENDQSSFSVSVEASNSSESNASDSSSDENQPFKKEFLQELQKKLKPVIATSLSSLAKSNPKIDLYTHSCDSESEVLSSADSSTPCFTNDDDDNAEISYKPDHPDEPLLALRRPSTSKPQTDAKLIWDSASTSESESSHEPLFFSKSFNPLRARGCSSDSASASSIQENHSSPRPR